MHLALPNESVHWVQRAFSSEIQNVVPLFDHSNSHYSGEIMAAILERMQSRRPGVYFARRNRIACGKSTNQGISV